MSDKARITLCMDKDWAFHLGEVQSGAGLSHNDIYSGSKAGAVKGVPQSDFDVNGWETVNLPHDWSVKQPFDRNGSPSWGYKPKGKAWYRKTFFLPKEYEGKELLITFEGVAKDAYVYFNGSLLARNFTAYAPFTVDVSDRAFFDSRPNVLAVFVDADGFEGWWYEGAGIYRSVRLDVKDKINIAQNGIFVKGEIRKDKWVANITLDICNHTYEDRSVTVLCRLKNKQTGEQAAEYKFHTFTNKMGTVAKSILLYVPDPMLWDIDSPNLYECRIWLYDGEKLLDDAGVDLGFRTIAFDSEKGFFLNGRSVKIYGTCNHQDHGGLGVALSDSVIRYRITRLKQMGSNAYRCAHGIVHKALLDECDRQGMLVLDENRSFETSEDCLEQLRTMVRRDRNHPSVIMYSIFNEEPLQGTKNGALMAQRMIYEIRQLDDSRLVTGAMNGGVLEDDGCADKLDVCGINYIMDSYDKLHAKHPKLCIIGSETTSTFAVRDCCKTDREKHEFSCYDEDPADWGSTVRQTWDIIRHRDYAAGAFMWTGFDYLGEPTPFEWPSVSSFFGMMDICGFPKDGYYLCKAYFSDEPVVHVLPHWNFTGQEGKPVRVMSHTNCEQAELFLNGRSLGKQDIDIDKQAYWEVPFEAGELKLVGYNGGKAVCEDIRRTAGEAARLILRPFERKIKNDGIDLAIVDIIAVDEDGNEVTDFEQSVELSCAGGEVIASSNGDPNCHEDFTSSKRSLFHGKAQFILRCYAGYKNMAVFARCDGVECKAVKLDVIDAPPENYVESVTDLYLTDWHLSTKLFDEMPDIASLKNDPTDNNSFEPVDISAGTPQRLSDCIGKFALYTSYVTLPESNRKITFDTFSGGRTVVHFSELWGKCRIYINRQLVGETEGYWNTVGLDCVVPHGISGRCELIVCVESTTKYGCGVCGSVILR